MAASVFDAIYDEFDVELRAIEFILDELDRAGTNPGAPRARIAGANGSHLLIAAVYEEFIRQSVKEVFVARVDGGKPIAELGLKIQSAVWRKSMAKLRRYDDDERIGASAQVRSMLNGIVKFCLDSSPTADVADIVCYNDNNMSVRQTEELFQTIGVKSVLSKVASIRAVRSAIGSPSKADTETQIKSRLTEFYRKRNKIAHSFVFGSASSVGELKNYISTFRAIGIGLTEVCQAYV
jgi:hypothetical protein